jgi:hypothetical protein
MPDAANGFAQTAVGKQPADNAGPTAGVLDSAIQRLEEIVEQETAALRSRRAVDLRDFNNKKSQGLLELNRALRGLGGAPHELALSARLAGLRARLETNRTMLKMHLDAVREISAIVTDAIREAESDGTYSRTIRKSGHAYD